ncbi:hypothetical protein OCH239_07545 [Roseivivax halodurans JCM 10272]|uniref:Uncharacterized protein n=1 Tax=Roseivivax halodurans JCM 10272 TaxID=1449350 RepID=X7EJZ7_9RHOB|nr:hypothetical protein [Roseivivax halodurans]ETX16252.1 hypothetical protein OCH239_07545 [Roseivivax halodurans JCM 10272]
MDNKTIGAGVIGLVVGAVVGLVGAKGGPDIDQIRAAIGEGIAPATEAGEASSAGIAALEGRLASLSEQLAALEEGMTREPADPPGLAPLGEKVDALRGAMSEAFATSAGAQEGLNSALTSMSDGFESLGTALAAMGGSGPLSALAGDRAPASASGGSAPAPDGEAAAAVAAAGDTEGLSVGETAIFADGALRAFVSRIDTEGGSVRLAVNTEVMTLVPGETVHVGDCVMALDSLRERTAMISAACGDDLPSPEGARPGEVLRFADGEVRVFVSGMSQDEGTARLAVNGLALQPVSVGESLSVPEMSCSVTLDAVDRGHASISSDC